MSYILFVNETATTEIYTLSLHDALPISFTPPEGLPSTTRMCGGFGRGTAGSVASPVVVSAFFGSSSSSGRAMTKAATATRSEEHTSELQSRQYLVCRLLLEKKKNHQLVR